MRPCCRASLGLCLTLLAACAGSEGADDAEPDDIWLDAPIDGDDDARDWTVEHCRGRDCFYVMQAATSASDETCNGRSPVDLGTLDGDGLGDCPFASLQGPVRGLLNPPTDPARALTVFVGAGTYPVFPDGLRIWGGGRDASESVRLTPYGSEPVIIDGNCPSACSFDTPDGVVTLEPCCRRECPSCDTDPRCLATPGGETDCAVPIDRVEQLLTLWGQWIRVEGLDLRGCWEDNIRVSYETVGQPPVIVPNAHLYLANNRIEGCDVNENIKGLRNGPGPVHGGPSWGPVHVVGNELYAMASQAVDATGVHNWLVEDNDLRDARVGSNEFVDFDGGGLGFNGGSAVRVRNNWSAAGGGFHLGGVSGSCIRDEDPPNDWGCFQRYEMVDVLLENNVALAATRQGIQAYQCDDCRILGNVIEGVDGEAAFFLRDDCPGDRCPPHNPDLRPSRNLELARNRFVGGHRGSDGPFLLAYHRDVHPEGPAGHGMSSRDNVLCAADGFDEVSDPERELVQFGHGTPTELFALAEFRSHIGDSGSVVFNDPGAAVAACPAGPDRCLLAVADGVARWAGPESCDGCTCRLAWDEAEQPVDCVGELALPTAATRPGRHYLALRVDRAGGGTSCGASYHVAAPMIGAACTVGVSATAVSWHAEGGRCELTADGGRDLGEVACQGERLLDETLTAPGRHHLRLRVRDAVDGQTACGVMFSP